ncbi:MAG: hypothetical protein JWR25_916 [Noviherbaspirillum sp.]|nr:hypothetical protein [Noviherbaspirillum sp.]
MSIGLGAVHEEMQVLIRQLAAYAAAFSVFLRFVGGMR